MEVNEPVEESKAEEVFREFAASAEPEPISAAAPAQPSPCQPFPYQPSWLRLAYCAEFLLALLTVFTVWSEVGGQGHLDLMPWYAKFILAFGVSWCGVRFTAAIVEQPRVWNRRAVGWLVAIIALCAVMAAITYYYHLHEDQDEPDSEDTTSTAMRNITPQSPIILTSDWTKIQA